MHTKDCEERHTPARLTAGGKTVLVAASLAFLLGCLLSRAWLIDLSLFSLVVVTLAMPLSYVNLSRLRAACETPELVHRGEAFEVEATLRNRKGLLPSFDLCLHLSARGTRSVELLYPCLSCLSTARDVKPIMMRSRGVLPGFRYTLSSTFPLGLVRRTRSGFLPHRFISSPRPYIPDDFQRLLTLGGGDELNRGGVTHDRRGEFRSMREYRPGDHPRLIAWSVSTRLEKLVVRELEDPRHRHLAVLFHSYHPAGVILSPRTFEKSLELVAGLVRFLSNRFMAFDMVASFNEWRRMPITPDAASVREVQTLLAEARMRPTQSADELRSALQALAADDRTLLVVSNAPSKWWLGLLPPSDSPIIYVDNNKAGVRMPGTAR